MASGATANDGQDKAGPRQLRKALIYFTGIAILVGSCIWKKWPEHPKVIIENQSAQVISSVTVHVTGEYETDERITDYTIDLGDIAPGEQVSSSIKLKEHIRIRELVVDLSVHFADGTTKNHQHGFAMSISARDRLQFIIKPDGTIDFHLLIAGASQ